MSIPNHSAWEVLTLAEAGVSLIDCVHKTPPAQETGLPYIAIPQMKEGHLDFESARRISETDFIEWTKKALPEANDVILSRRCNPGTTAAVTNGDKFALGQNLVLLRANGTRVFPPFLRWLVRGQDWWNEIGRFLNVGAVFDSLRCADVPKFELPIPPLHEQRAIASVLGSLDDKIELNRRMNRTLEQMAAAIFKAWFVDFEPVRAKASGATSFPGMPQPVFDVLPATFADSELGPIPEGWKASRLGYALEIHDSKRVPLSRKQREERQGTYPYYGATGIFDYVDDYLFDGTFVLIGEDGSVIQEDGTPFSQYVWGKLWVNNHAHVLTGKGYWTAELIYLLLRDLYIAPFVTGAVQAKLNQGNMKSIPVVIPSGDALEACQEQIGPLFDLIRSTTNEIQALAGTRDALLPKLLSGEVRVDIEAEVA